jgi:hypothetical protein
LFILFIVVGGVFMTHGVCTNCAGLFGGDVVNGLCPTCRGFREVEAKILAEEEEKERRMENEAHKST